MTNKLQQSGLPKTIVWHGKVYDVPTIEQLEEWMKRRMEIGSSRMLRKVGFGFWG